MTFILLAALRYGGNLSRLLGGTSDESPLLAVSGITLFVAGAAQSLEVSGAIGAFLLGLALSGEVAERANRLIAPLRDLFAATFFVFISFQIDPRDLLNTLGLALILAVVTAATKVVTGWYARFGAGDGGRLRAGTVLIGRSEFSIVIAALGSDLAAGYVLVTAVVGPPGDPFQRPDPDPGLASLEAAGHGLSAGRVGTGGRVAIRSG